MPNIEELNELILIQEEFIAQQKKENELLEKTISLILEREAKNMESAKITIENWEKALAHREELIGLYHSMPLWLRLRYLFRGKI